MITRSATTRLKRTGARELKKGVRIFQVGKRSLKTRMLKMKKGSACSVPTIKTSVLCEICLQGVDRKETPKLDCCDKIVCLPCLKKYILSCSNDHTGSIFPCPISETCPSISPTYTCFKVMMSRVRSQKERNNIYTRMTKAKIKADISHSLGLVQCPGVDCKNVVYIEKEKLQSDCHDLSVKIDERRFSCSECNFESCILCKEQWRIKNVSHENISCKKYKENIKMMHEADEVETTNMIKTLKNQRKLKKCPNCRVLIEKNGGCDNMYCAWCKRSFSWN
eukprot:snap_masked-scaffold_6-processed-gene-5.32-mRNA-1 protein AED:1.00 eAED:1.00 QI:0/-1/0/0/-1/1/1/0/278